MKNGFVALVAATLFWSSAARAELVTYDFTAINTVVNGSDPIALANGQAFSGSITVDTAAPTQPGGSANSIFYVGTIKTINLGGVVLDVSQWAVNQVGVSEEDTSPGQNGYDFLAEDASFAFGLELHSFRPLLPGGLSLPDQLPTLSFFATTQLAYFPTVGPTAFAEEPLTSLGSVPEPSPFAIFGASLTLFFFVGRGKRK